MSVYLLDCTLRDGGYINDWEFGRELYDAFGAGLQSAGADYIELGIMGQHRADHFKTKFRSLEEIPVPAKTGSAGFTVMMTGGEYKKISVPERVPGESVDAVRYAFFKADADEAPAALRDLTAKGYRVFAQTMATFQYSERELLSLVDSVNGAAPYAFYIVDSFGTLYPEDIRRLYRLVNRELRPDILFGIHAHNNLQMANANAITFIEEAAGRDIIVDGSVYGMGRGAGNAQTEVLMSYLNRAGGKYDVDTVWELYNRWIAPIREEYKWGYLPEQFLVSRYETNPAYVWYLARKGVTDFDAVRRVLERLPDDKRYTLFPEEADKLLEGGNV